MSVGASLMNPDPASAVVDPLDIAGAPDDVEKRRRYAAMVERFRTFVGRTVPPRVRLAVVSKGDDELLRLGDRDASHFPRDPSGGYAGFHPESGAHAVEMMQAERRDGIEYVVMPATSLWWRDAYPEFHEHLRTRYHLLAEEDGTGAIYELRGRTAPRPEEPAEDDEVAQLESLVAAVLPDGARVAVVADGVGARCRFSRWSPAGLHAWPTAPDALPKALEGFESIRQTADFLVIPAADVSAPRFRAVLIEAIAERSRPVLEHRHVCAIRDLRASDGHAPQDVERPAADDPGGIADVARLILPAGAVVVLAGSDDDLRADLGHVELVRLLLPANTDLDGVLRLLEQWHAAGAEYLVMPAILADTRSAERAREALDRRYSCRWADARCLVYDLTTPRRRGPRRSANGRSGP